MRFLLAIFLFGFSFTLTAQAQPIYDWKLLLIDKSDAHYVHPDTVTRPSADVVVYWSKWTKPNGLIYKFRNRILLEEYGIDWKSPPEMNPDVMYD